MQVEKKIEDEIARELRTSEKKKKRVNDKKNDIETSVNSVISLRRLHLPTIFSIPHTISFFSTR